MAYLTFLKKGTRKFANYTREVLPSVMGSDIWEAMLDEFEGARERVARLMDNHNV